MGAFFATYAVAGWRPGDDFPAGQVALMASGAAFATVIVGQTANAFACRSSTRWPGSLGWTTNRLLILAVIADLAIAAAMLGVPILANALGQAVPGAVGWAISLATVPVVLGLDAAYKALRKRSDQSTPRPGDRTKARS